MYSSNPRGPTLGALLEFGHLPLTSALLGQVARKRLAAAHDLPADCLSILEVRLAPDEPEVDLSIRLVRPDQAHQLARQIPFPWPHLEFLARWAEQEPEREQIPAIWLEFDFDQDRDRLHLPLLCAQLGSEITPLWVTNSLLPALQGRPLTIAQREHVLLCVGAVSPPARLLYAFSLLSRPGGAVRLEILGLGPAETRDYLARVAPHTLPTLAEIAPFLEGAENRHLSFDIDEVGTIQSRIGLEGAFSRQPPREPRWAELLARWVELGLCSPEKRDAVLAWPGQDSYWNAPDRWPAEGGIGGRFVRFLSHVKVVGQPGRRPEAKAYLGFENMA